MRDAHLLEFSPEGSSAINKYFRIRVVQPRMLPARGAGEVEFDYTIYIGEDRFGLGFLGTLTEAEDRNSAYIVLLIDPAPVIDSIIDLRAISDCPIDDFDFLVSMARGFLCVFSSGYGVSRPTKYSVIARQSVLETKFPTRLIEDRFAHDGFVELASLFVDVNVGVTP